MFRRRHEAIKRSQLEPFHPPRKEGEANRLLGQVRAGRLKRVALVGPLGRLKVDAKAADADDVERRRHDERQHVDLLLRALRQHVVDRIEFVALVEAKRSFFLKKTEHIIDHIKQNTHTIMRQ